MGGRLLADLPGGLAHLFEHGWLRQRSSGCGHARLGCWHRGGMVARWQGIDLRWRRGGWRGGSGLLCLGAVTGIGHRLALPLLGRRRLKKTDEPASSLAMSSVGSCFLMPGTVQRVSAGRPGPTWTAAHR